jgi:hypothetical protein
VLLAALLIGLAGWLLTGAPARAQYPPPQGSLGCNSTALEIEAGTTVPLEATLLSVSNVPIPDIGVSFLIEQQPGSAATVTPGTTVTDASGIARADLFAGNDTGQLEVAAQSTIVSCRFTFTVIVPPRAATVLPVLPQNPIAQVQSVVDIPSPKGLERPLLFRGVPGLDDISLDAKTIGISFLLSVVMLTLILFASTMFNSTLEENGDELASLMGGILRPMGAALGLISMLPLAIFGRWGRVLRPLFILGLTSVIYSLLEPDFGFNERTLLVLSSLAITLGITTYLYEGSQILTASRRYSLPGAVQVYPAAIVIALLSVLVSRAFHLNPGIVYGFVAAFAITSGDKLLPRDEARIIYPSMIGLFAISLVAWLLISPFRSMALDSNSWLTALPEAIAVAIFLGGIEGLLFNLIPFTFNDGEKVWRWDKRAWAIIALPSLAIFIHILINREDSVPSALAQGSVIASLGLCLGITALALATWLAFKVRKPDHPVAV